MLIYMLTVSMLKNALHFVIIWFINDLEVKRHQATFTYPTPHVTGPCLLYLGLLDCGRRHSERETCQHGSEH